MRILGFTYIVGIFLIFCSSFDINMTSVGFIMDKEAYLLLGFPTSQFPKESFLNYLLYGHTDVNFTYKDFMNSYGRKVDKPEEGYLIIGNDFKLGGMVLELISTVALPIPGSVITKVPFSQISKYFPNGYTILASKDSEFIFGYGGESSTYGEIQICGKNCLAGFGFADDDSVFPFQLNNYLEKWILSDIVRLDFTLYGYLEEWDSNIYKGRINVRFYEVYGEGMANYFLINEKYPHYIFINAPDHKNFTYYGSIYAEIPNYSEFYNFTGYWSRW